MQCDIYNMIWFETVDLCLQQTNFKAGEVCKIGNNAHHPDDGGSTYLWNVGRQLFYTAVHPRRQIRTSYSPPWELEISQEITRLKKYVWKNEWMTDIIKAKNENKL
jgi:hypothetical protein